MFQTALANANEVLADTTLTKDDQKVVDQAVKDLADARDALKLKETEPTGDGNKPEGDGNGDDTTNGNQNTAPETGDDSMTVMWIGLLAIMALGGAFMLCQRRRRIR